MLTILFYKYCYMILPVNSLVNIALVLPQGLPKARTYGVESGQVSIALKQVVAAGIIGVLFLIKKFFVQFFLFFIYFSNIFLSPLVGIFFNLSFQLSKLTLTRLYLVYDYLNVQLLYYYCCYMFILVLNFRLSHVNANTVYDIMSYEPTHCTDDSDGIVLPHASSHPWKENSFGCDNFYQN